MRKRNASTLPSPKQRSIFDFSLQNTRQSLTSEIIDLSLDIDDDCTGAIEFASTESVACPICMIDLSLSSLDKRESHVYACLNTGSTVKRQKMDSAETNQPMNCPDFKVEVPREVHNPLFVAEDEEPELVLSAPNDYIDQKAGSPLPNAATSPVSIKCESGSLTSPIDIILAPIKCESELSTSPVHPKLAPIKFESESSTSPFNIILAPIKQEKPSRNNQRNTQIPHKETHEREKKRYVNQGREYCEQIKVIKPPTKKISTTVKRRPIPQVKLLDFPFNCDQTYTVSFDAFNYSPHATVDQYFLTHFHADHYGGITKSWSYERVFGEDTDFEDDSKYKSIVYCTTITGKLLTIRIGVDPRFIFHMELDTRYCVKRFDLKLGPLNLNNGGQISEETTPGLYATPLTANHCPGAGIFLMESISLDGEVRRMLHCGDFRVCRDIFSHPLLAPFSLDPPINQTQQLHLDKVYLDTTYMTPTYNFPKQELVCQSTADMFHDLCADTDLFETWFGLMKQLRITDFLTLNRTKKKKKILVLVGTYVIGKEKLAIAILKRLQCQIFVLDVNSRGDKHKILRTYKDDYLDSVLTSDPLGNDSAEFSQSPCVVHLVPMKIVGGLDHLSNYFNHNGYFEHFERCVGIRPTGWTFALPQARAMGELFNKDKLPGDQLSALAEMLSNTPEFGFDKDILPQIPPRNNKKTAKATDSLYRIYTVPYSEHSSFRELAYFVMFFNIKNVIPTVNIHNEFSILNMLRIIDIWEKGRSLRSGESVRGGNDDLAIRFENLSLENF